jgi:glycosyltransferase involved in cell wall biosynthesis
MVAKWRCGLSGEKVKLSAIIPVHNDAQHLMLCLTALSSSTRVPDQIIVVDDSSTDDSGNCARELGAQLVVLTQGPRGPAWARNQGAEIATGDVLLFIDADVMVHSNTIAVVERKLIDHPEIAALFGSYDLHPPGGGVVSQYKNLMHHYVHQHAQREAFTFWAGCGAIRREVFEQLGGFDAGFANPSVEDIELGSRLRDAGLRVWLCRDVLVTHLKEWSLVSMLRSDIRDRAVPWSRLILSRGKLPDDLNVDVSSRLSAIVAWVGVSFLVIGFFFAWAWLVTALAVVVLALLNAELYIFMARQGGVVLAIAGAGLHTLYLLYSSAIFGGILILTRLNKRLVDKSR